MNDEQRPRNPALERLRLVSGYLSEDVRLRQALDDGQAQQLLAWALAHLKSEAERTARLSPDDALSLLEQLADGLGQVMRLVNRFLSGSPGGGAEQDWGRSFLERLEALTGYQAYPESRAEIAALDQGRERLDRATAFARLMAVLQAEAPVDE